MSNDFVTSLFVSTFKELNKDELEHRKRVLYELLGQRKSVSRVFRSLDPTEAEIQAFENELFELIAKVLEHERIGFQIYMGVIRTMDKMNMPEEHQHSILEKMIREHYLSA